MPVSQSLFIQISINFQQEIYTPAELAPLFLDYEHDRVSTVRKDEEAERRLWPVEGMRDAAHEFIGPKGWRSRKAIVTKPLVDGLHAPVYVRKDEEAERRLWLVKLFDPWHSLFVWSERMKKPKGDCDGLL